MRTRPGAEIDEPARTEPLVAGLSQLIGGPRGEHAAAPRAGRFWTPARVVLALACLVFALHWLQKSPCMDGAWVDNVQYKRACYTDVLALYYAEGLDKGQVPYADHPVEYPVLTGAFMGALGLPVHAVAASHPGVNQGEWFYNLNAFVLSALGVATVGVVLALRRRRPWDAAMLALAPAMLFTATVNWDLFAVFLFAAAMLLWARRRPAWAGLLLGLAVAAKFYPLLFIGPLLVLALRARGTIRPALTTAFVAVLTWLAVNLPVALLWPASWKRFFELNNSRPIDWGTLWYIGAHFPTGADRYGLPWFQALDVTPPTTLNTLYFALFAACCVGILALAWFAPRRPRLAQLTFLVVAAFLMTGKVWSQQYVLWLIPLAVLARPRWRGFLLWQAAEIGYFLAFYGELLGVSSNGKHVFPEGVFVLAAGCRLLTLLLLCGLVVRDILRPERDAVRQTYDDDPDGGVFDGVPDARWITRLRGAGTGRSGPVPAPTS